MLSSNRGEKAALCRQNGKFRGGGSRSTAVSLGNVLSGISFRKRLLCKMTKFVKNLRERLTSAGKSGILCLALEDDEC
jgi:hypothetical protein